MFSGQRMISADCRGKYGRMAGVAFLCGVMLLSIAGVQHRLTTLKGSSWRYESFSFLPQTERISRFLMGFATTYAGYLWIKTVLYFGGHSQSDQRYPMLVTMTDMVTRLNPRFYPAYEFAGLMLPDHTGNPRAARVILERGVGTFGTSKWKLCFYLADLCGRYLHDYTAAALWLERAAEIPGTPSYLRVLSANYHLYGGNIAAARMILAAQIQSAESPQVKEYLTRKLLALERDMASRHSMGQDAVLLNPGHSPAGPLPK